MMKAEVEAVLKRVRSWPENRQADLASIAMQMERQGHDIYGLDDEELADLNEAVAEADRGELATNDEVEALFAKYRG